MSISQFTITLEKVKYCRKPYFLGFQLLTAILVGQFEGNRLVQARVIPYSFQHKKGELSCDAVNSEPMSIQNKIKEDVDITYTYSIKFEENNNVSPKIRADCLASLKYGNFQIFTGDG